jgi:alpha-glucosidase
MPESGSLVPDRPLWWQRGVVYQIYPRSFQDTNGDGTGDLAGVIRRLDYLSDTLGIDAIWLSPFFPSPNADFGYDVSDYCAVDPLFGDLATFDQLVAEAHARDVRIIIDYVPNHCSEQHPWFIESRAARDSSKRDWFYWADPRPDGSPPNNWLAVFGGSAWEWDAATGQYYLHTFLPEQPDLNWRNPETRAAMLDVLRFWLERGVDGVRIDAIPFLMKDPALRDNPPAPAGTMRAHKSHGHYDSILHVHDVSHPDLHPVLQEMRALFDGFSRESGVERVTIGEAHIFDWDDWSRYYGLNLDELHLPFNFNLLKVGWTANEVRESVHGLETALSKLPPGAWPNYVLGNHDESRIATRVGPESARLAMMLLLTLRGTPTIYYGDELGMEDVPVPPEKVQDPWGLRVTGLGLGRDPQRVPMLWDDSPNAGFSAVDADPWLPIAPDYRERNVAAQMADPRSMLNLTRTLLRLRRESSALSIGSYTHVDDTPADCFAYWRTAGDERLLIALNFSSEERSLSLGDDSLRIDLSTLLDRDQERPGGTLVLRPHEGCLLTRGADQP